MKKTILLFMMQVLLGSAYAQQKEVLPLWATEAPNRNGLEQNTDYQEPQITVYHPTNSNGKTIIMCPGGGYGMLAIEHEGHDMAEWMNSMGITYVVLEYRLPNGHCEVPLTDAKRAIELVRSHAHQWNIDTKKVGIMGASAGGHLAATLATQYGEEQYRPDFQILFYPVITMSEAYAHHGSAYSLLGKEASEELKTRFSCEKNVTKATPPAFIMLSSDDTGVYPQNSISYYNALIKNGIKVSLHSYPSGGHGWGFSDHFPFKSEWMNELEKWLDTLSLK